MNENAADGKLIFERLQSYHARQAFDCGKSELNRYLQQHARQNADRNTGVTHVVVAAPGGSDVLGYYTLLVRTIAQTLIPATLPAARRLPPGEIGVVLLGRLAVDKRAQGKGIGRQMLLQAMLQTYRASQDMGIYALVLDALDDAVREWYLKLRFGFEPLSDDPHHLCVPIATIAQLVQSTS